MSQTLFVLLLAAWALILLTQVVALVAGRAIDGWAIVAIVVAVGGTVVTMLLKRRTGQK